MALGQLKVACYQNLLGIFPNLFDFKLNCGGARDVNWREGLSTNNTDINSVLESSHPYIAKVEMKTAHPSKMQHVESWFSRPRTVERSIFRGKGIIWVSHSPTLLSTGPSLRREIRTTVYRGNNGLRRHLNSVNFFPREKNEPMFTGREVIPKLEQYQTPKFRNRG